MMDLRGQIDYCKRRIAAGSADSLVYKAILDSLLLLERCGLLPEGVDGQVYQQFVERYFAFREARGAKARMTPGGGKALKEVIAYLLSIPKIGGDEQKAFASWDYIFKHWHLLSDYLRAQVALSQVGNNIEEIIDQLTHVSKKTRRRAEQADKERFKQAVKNRR